VACGNGIAIVSHENEWKSSSSPLQSDAAMGGAADRGIRGDSMTTFNRLMIFQNWI
jgi:hypothetical protein